MDRLTTGRRHLRAGSVTVTELISRQTSPTFCTDSSPATPDTDDDAITDVIPVVVAAHRREEPAKGAQFAKLASLGVAGVVLCGAVTIASVIAHQRRENEQPTTLRPTVQITGEQALLPDKLDETLPNGPAQAPPVRQATEERQTPDTPVAVPTPPITHSDNTSASGGAVSANPANDLDLVRAFYASLPESPATAFGLVSPDVLDMSLSDFLESWSTVTAIDSVDVVQRADGVLATVRMRLLAGGQLRIQQLLTVGESPRRIVGVQLLSAQRN